MARPLEGVRVVEQGSFITGPCAAMLLGDLGAEVVKVEPPAGDPYRQYGGGAYSPHFRAYNRNKKSICLDLNQPDDRAVLYELVDDADVYLHNLRPGVAERLGVGEVELRSRNPRLIYCAISGYGPSGPYVGRPGYDATAQALSGFLSVMTDPDDPRIAGPALADPITGIYAAYGILAALYERSRTNRGRRIDISMLEAVSHFAIEPFTTYFCLGATPQSSDRPRLSQSYALRCADDKLVAVHLSSIEKFWTNLLDAIASPELAADARFATRQGRIDGYDALKTILNEHFGGRPRHEWLTRLTDRDVPHAAVNTISEAADDPQVQHLELLVPVVHPTEGAAKTVRPALTFDHQRTTHVAAAPTVGEHTHEIRDAIELRASRRARSEPSSGAAVGGSGGN